MEEEIRQLERKLKQALSEQEHLREHNTYLTSELDRFVHIHYLSNQSQILGKPVHTEVPSL